MRSRAYRPEAPGYLEDRSLLSGVAGPSADPVIFSRHQLSLAVEHIQSTFDVFARTRDFLKLPQEIDDFVVTIPFVRADGLEESIHRILRRMRHDFFAHVPHAFRRARIDVNAAIRADVEARVRAGDLVVR